MFPLFAPKLRRLRTVLEEDGIDEVCERVYGGKR